MKGNKKFIFWEIIFLLIVYTINVFPYSVNGKYFDKITLVFLNFEGFGNVGMEKFSPQFIIMFLIFLYVNCIKILSIENENIDLKSMYLTKFTRKGIIKKIVKEYVLHYCILGMITYVATLVFHHLSAISIPIKQFEINELLICMFYLIRVFTIILMISIIYSIYCLMKSKIEMIPILFIGFAIIIFIDLLFNQSLITLSNSLEKELVNFIFEFGGLYLIYLHIRLKFLKKEDLFND